MRVIVSVQYLLTVKDDIELSLICEFSHVNWIFEGGGLAHPLSKSQMVWPE